MHSLCSASDRQPFQPPFPFASLGMMAPDLGLPRTPNARNIPPMPRPDVLLPEEDEDGEEIDLPVEDRPDTGVGGVNDEDQPEEEREAPRPEEVRRRRDDTGEPLPPKPEKQRKPEVDDPVPQPETGRKRAPTLQ